MTDSESTNLATLWFLAARAMAIAGEDMPVVQEAATGLYAQAILGLSEEECKKAKDAECIINKTLIDCLSGLRNLPSELAEKVITGVMMISYADRSMRPLEVRWASMLAPSRRSLCPARGPAGFLPLSGRPGSHPRRDRPLS